MNIRRFVFFVAIMLLLSGCSKITNDLDDVIDATMINNKTSVNTVSVGYEIYIPMGVGQVYDSQYNQKFKIRNRYVYLYVDTISYYYKNMLNYKSDDSYNYYYRELSINDKVGYIGVNKVEDDLYFCEIIFNYSKIEFYANLDDLSLMVADSLIMQKSIVYNDNLIKKELENTISDGREVTYELAGPKENKSTFSDYLQEYVDDEEDVTLPENE